MSTVVRTHLGENVDVHSVKTVVRCLISIIISMLLNLRRNVTQKIMAICFKSCAVHLCPENQLFKLDCLKTYMSAPGKRES